MAKPAKKLKKKTAATKAKLSKGKKPKALEKASSKVQKKKQKSVRDEEEVIRKKRVAAKKRKDDEDDDIESEDEIDDENQRIDTMDVEDDDTDGDTEDLDDEAEEDVKPSKKSSRRVEPDEDDTDGDSDDDADDDDSGRIELNDLSKVDPGPDAREVPCGFFCGNCRKFVKIDDPKRNDPEWLTQQMSLKSQKRCPFLFPEEVDLKPGENLVDFVVTADDKACDKFDFNEDRATPELATVLDLVRTNIDTDALNILSFQVDKIRMLKEMEESFGYKLGERFRVVPPGLDISVNCEVIEFQKKKGAEVIVRPLQKLKDVPSRMAIPARRAVGA